MTNIDKKGYADFMLKEIHEQPETVIKTLDGKIDAQKGTVTLKSLDKLDAKKIERVIFVGCGTSWNSSLVGKFYIEKYAKLPVEVDIASEFTYREGDLGAGVLCVLLSQSGETSDTMAALNAAKRKGATTLAICNVEGSSIPKGCDYAIYTKAGVEVSIASTKAFTSQTVTNLLLALWLGEQRGTLSADKIKTVLADVQKTPKQLENLLKKESSIKTISDEFKKYRNFIFLGKHINSPIAFEGALKLKETSYIHAEGYPAGELKHGPIALLDGDFAVFVIAPTGVAKDKAYEAVKNSMDRGANVIGVFSESEKGKHPNCTHAIYIDDCSEDMSVYLTVTAAQLFAYFCAKGLGREVDSPRSLSKSVVD